jgi:hypothetical protein
MDQLITLLTNLLNLTKVAAVTVPGLPLTGAFAVIAIPLEKKRCPRKSQSPKEER